MPEHILFLTGRLAEPNLKKTLESIDSRIFTFDVRQIGVSVAALITGDMIKRRLSDCSSYDKIMLPGLCAGNTDELSNHFGAKFIKGPKELNDLPEYFGSPAQKTLLDKYSVLLFAEIVDAPLRTVEEIVEKAYLLKESGADVIDIGCLPSQPFPHLEEAIQELKNKGFKTSVDSLSSDELLRGGKAGANYLLSLSKETLWLADEVESIPVIIPEADCGVDSLYEAVELLIKNERPFFADSILNPVHFGFTESIVQYLNLRERFPEINIMIGTGNITELTEADTMGMTALLMGIVSELNAGAVLTTQVSEHACSVVKETDLARRIMYAAKQQSSLPKGYSRDLLALHEKKPFPVSAEEIQKMAKKIRDPSFRIQTSDEGIHVYNRDGIHTSDDPYKIYPHLNVEDDASHAFYLGYELAKAEISRQLGKRYTQDRNLSWGCIVPDESSGDHYKETRSTSRSKAK